MILLKKIWPFSFVALLLTNFFLASWIVLHKDLSFTSEIARDFMLLDELARKKVILIGPNSSTGLFHGPLWTYLNFPAYFIGNGNPVIVGWFWIMLIMAFTVSNYYFAKALFGKAAGYLFALMTSLYIAFHSANMYNPHGALLLMPATFFFFVKYLQTKRKLYLILNLLFSCAVVQFQLADGVPLLMLFGLAETITFIKNKCWWHFLSFLLVPLSFTNFLIFDFRHEHLYAKLLLHFLVSPARDRPNYLTLLGERINLLFSGQEILHQDLFSLNLWLFIFITLFVIIQIKQNKFRLPYLSYLYLFFGYYALSLFNTGPILYFYMFPLFPLVFLIFCSLINTSAKPFFWIMFGLVYVWNFQIMVRDTIRSADFLNKKPDSWSFMLGVANRVYHFQDKQFGYFVYEPSVLAYAPKYAMMYAQKINPNQSFYFTKKPVTYIIAAPPAASNPYLSYPWWVAHQVNISEKPVAVVNFPNGYKIEKYLLTEAETKIPIQPNLDPGLTFR